MDEQQSMFKDSPLVVVPRKSYVLLAEKKKKFLSSSRNCVPRNEGCRVEVEKILSKSNKTAKPQTFSSILCVIGYLRHLKMCLW